MTSHTPQLMQPSARITCCTRLQTKAKVNVGFWGGITPENAHKHDVLWGMLKAGALGFKSFVSPSGINDFENVSRSDVADAMHFLLSKGAPYFVHAELVTDVEQAEVRATLHATRAYLGLHWGRVFNHKLLSSATNFSYGSHIHPPRRNGPPCLHVHY